MPTKGQKKRALSGNSSSGISPPKTRSKRSPKARNKLSKEHLSELELEARDIESDKVTVSEIARASSSPTSVEMASHVPQAEVTESSEPVRTNGEGHDETLVDFDGFTPADIDANSNDSGKLVSMMKSLMKGINDVKADNAKLLSGQDVMKQDLSKIQADNVQLRSELNSLKGAHGKLSGDVVKVRQDLSATQQKVRETDNLVKKHDTALKDQGAAIKQLQESRPDGEPAKPKEFAYSKTVVAEGVYISDDEWWNDNENVKRKAECIVHKQLGLPGVTVVRSKRQGATDNYVGIVKIELANEYEAGIVVKNSWRLGQNPDPSVKRIFLRPSKPDEKRLEERNINALIDIVDPERRSVFLDRKTGTVRKKNQGGYRGRGRGRGRGSRGARGGHGRGRGRGQERDQQSNTVVSDPWSPSLAPIARGMGRGTQLQRSSSAGSLSSLVNMEGRDQSPPPFSTFTQRAASNTSHQVNGPTNATAASNTTHQANGLTNTATHNIAAHNNATNQHSVPTQPSGQGQGTVGTNQTGEASNSSTPTPS